MRTIIVASAFLALVPSCLEQEEEFEIGAEQAELRGGTVVPTGTLEAVVRIPGCTATLISDDTVLTAAHCVCGSSTDSCAPCRTRSSATFQNVKPVGSSTRTDVTIGADVLVHPNFCFGGSWLTQDYALLKLDQPARELVQVRPIYVEPNKPRVGDTVTLVGSGGTNVGATNNCNDGTQEIKRRGTTQLDQYKVYDDPNWGATLVFNDTAVGACKGDSGGPALSAAGRVLGVASVANLSTNSSYDATFAAWDWLSDNACPDFDPDNPDPSLCSNPLCPCASAEGDCDRDSECLSGSECVNNVGVSSGLPGYYDVCWDNDYLVTVYDGTSYNGASQSFPFGNWGASSMNEVGNDRVSSIDVAPGYSARLCSENGNWGNCEDYAGKSTLSGTSLNNTASNINVRPGVTVYDWSSYRGGSQTFTVGNYAAADLDIIGNDDITSLIAAPGINVRLCAENGGWGDCQEYGGRVSHVGSRLNQRGSNLQVRAGVSVYRGVDYTGVSQSFAAGTYAASSLSTIGNDKIRSIVVAPGMRATVCSESGGWGDCEEFTGWTSYVGQELDRRISYIRVYPLYSWNPTIRVNALR